MRIPSTGLATYPDGAVVCGGTRRADDDRMAVTNPILLIEVTSNSSEDYDRGEKLRHYRAISTLREVLIVSHREARVTLHRRGDDGQWTTIEAAAGEAVGLALTGKSLVVDDIYRDGLEDAGN